MKSNWQLSAVRYLLFGVGALGLVLTFGFFTFQTWATMLIPWSLNPLGAIFLASILAAVAVPVLWIAWTREYAGIVGGAINLGLTFAGWTAFSLRAYLANPRLPVLLFGLVCAGGLLVSLGLLVVGLRQSFQDARAMPRLVRVSFAAFATILILTGSMLVFGRPGVFPWTLTSQQSVLYGWIFVGAASYFGYGVWRPAWGNAKGQLLGFLAYDVVLIVPLVTLFFGNEPFLLPNLVIYIAVLVYSGALALWYLWMDPVTRHSFKPANAS